MFQAQNIKKNKKNIHFRFSVESKIRRSYIKKNGVNFQFATVFELSCISKHLLFASMCFSILDLTLLTKKLIRSAMGKNNRAPGYVPSIAQKRHSVLKPIVEARLTLSLPRSES